MGRKLTGNPVGPPPKDIDWNLFEQLCSMQCTQYEMAGLLKVHPNTLSDRTKEKFGEEYSIVYKKLSEGGKCSLRRNQFVLSKTNASMGIWLGKQWLGQKDYFEQVGPNEKSLDLGLDLLKNDKTPELMKTIEELKAKIDALESKANYQLPASEPPL